MDTGEIIGAAVAVGVLAFAAKKTGLLDSKPLKFGEPMKFKPIKPLRL